MTTSGKRLTIFVCRGPSCGLMGSAALAQWCRDLEAAGIPLDFQITSCTGNCEEAPVVQWNQRYLTRMNTAKMTQQLMQEDAV